MFARDATVSAAASTNNAVAPLRISYGACLSGASLGIGAVLLVPLNRGFALHAVDRAGGTGPFEHLFSQRLLTMVVDHWPERVAPRASIGHPARWRRTCTNDWRPSPTQGAAAGRLRGVSSVVG